MNILQKKIMTFAKKELKNKYGDSIKNYRKHKIFDLLYSRSSTFTINYKEILILNNYKEYNKRYYKRKESFLKLVKILKYYINYLTFFCRPVFTHFPYNNLLQNYYDMQADIFYRQNYLKNGEENDFIKNNTNNNEDIVDSNDKVITQKNNNLIFDFNTRKYIETSTNILTSINIDTDDDKSNEPYIQKFKTSNNKYITIKSSNDDYLLDLIEIIKTKRKERINQNKNNNNNLKFSSSQIKNHSSKKNKFIKKNKILFNLNKNTIENKICTTYNIMKTLSKKKNIEKNIINEKIFNSNINLSPLKTKFKNNYIDSHKKLDKSQINKNKFSLGSGKKNNNLKGLKKKIIKKIAENINNTKPGMFSLYKKGSMNIKCYNVKNNYKMTSFSIYKNNSIINSHTNIYNKLYSSNSNSPLSKLKKSKNENKSDIFNFSKNGKVKKIEIKKHLNFNIPNYFSNKKINKKPINNYNINSNNDCINSNNNINLTKNKKYHYLFKKASNNNSINKNQAKKLKNNSNNLKTYESLTRKKSNGINAKNRLINNLSNYFDLNYLQNKSFLKNKPKLLKGIKNLHTFSMRLINKNKNKNNSCYLNINNLFFNQNFSFNNIDNSIKKNNTKVIGAKNPRNSYKNKNPIKLYNNRLDRLTKNLNNLTNIKLLYNKQNIMDKNNVNLNVNLNLNNINININASSSNTSNNDINSNINSNIIKDKLTLNKESNINLFYSKNKDDEINSKYNSYYKSRNKIKNKISKKNIEKIVNNFNFNIKKYQTNSKQIKNIINNKKNYVNSKSNLIMKDKIITNSSLSQSGFNKTLNLISQKKILNKIKFFKNDKKRVSSFIINKRYKEIITNFSKKGK